MNLNVFIQKEYEGHNSLREFFFRRPRGTEKSEGEHCSFQSNLKVYRKLINVGIIINGLIIYFHNFISRLEVEGWKCSGVCSDMTWPNLRQVEVFLTNIWTAIAQNKRPQGFHKNFFFYVAVFQRIFIFQISRLCLGCDKTFHPSHVNLNTPRLIKSIVCELINLSRQKLIGDLKNITIVISSITTSSSNRKFSSKWVLTRRKVTSVIPVSAFCFWCEIMKVRGPSQSLHLMFFFLSHEMWSSAHLVHVKLVDCEKLWFFFSQGDPRLSLRRTPRIQHGRWLFQLLTQNFHRLIFRQRRDIPGRWVEEPTECKYGRL